MRTKELYKWTLGLAVPLMIQNLISTLVNTADTVMLGFVGQTEMACKSIYVRSDLCFLRNGDGDFGTCCTVLG